ncbi:MAG: 30S ribosomal protein S2 [Candidatus Nomurabacteria bacterium]|nr:30S ribosomal protein S2 [Candidatus Nomurabacteria bacterium]
MLFGKVLKIRTYQAKKLRILRLSASMKRMSKTANTEVSIEKMFEAGAHYGYSKTRRHPSASSFVFTTKNKTDIIDLEKTEKSLKEACDFIKDLGARNKVILFVGTKPEAREAIKMASESINMPYVIERWIGGSISNFTEIKKRITELENYKIDSEKGDLEKYTKKERLILSKKMEKLSKYYSGMLGMKKIPDAVLVIDAKKEHIGATEARKCNVPVIALANTDSNIKGITYSVIANDASRQSISLFAKAFSEAYKAGQMSVPDKN